MKAIILAAGRGKRLKNFTSDKPKCLNLVGDKTIIEKQTSVLRYCGVLDITIVTGYRSTMLDGFGTKTIYNPEWERTNIARSLLCAAGEFTEPAIVSYSDILYGHDVVSRLIAQKTDAVVVYDLEWERLWRARFKDPLEDAESFKIGSDSRIREIGKKVASTREIEGQYTGLMRFTPKAFSWMGYFTAKQARDILDKMDMTTLLQGLIEDGYPIYGMAIKGGWCEIDTVSDLELAASLYGQRLLV